ncbi:MAG: hypothetical protein Q4F25_03730, partial [Eubacteriales bacterium]|nr:hypothetical protein [Eubacteriales bacterium]
MGNYRKWISLALSAVMAVSLAACGGGSGSEGGNGGNGGNGGGQTSEAVDVNCVYSAEQLMLDSGEDLTDLTLNTLRYVDDYIYASGYSYSDFGEGSHVLLKFSPSGDDVEVGYMMNGAAEDVLATCIGSDGNFYVVRAAYDDDLMDFDEEGAGLGSTMSEGPAPADEPSSEDDKGAAAATEPDEDVEISGEDVIEDADDEFVPIDGNEDGPVDIGEEVTDEGSPVNAEGAETAPDGSAVSDDEEEGDMPDGPAVSDDEGEEGDGSAPGGFDDDEIEDYTSAGEASPADEEAEESTDGITSPLDEYGDDPEIDAEDELTAETVNEVDGSVAESGDTSYVISCVNYEGTELWRAPCGPGEQTEDDMYYVNAIAYSEDGLIIADAKGLQLYSKEDGSFIRTIGEGENYSGCTPIVLPDGTAAV